MKSKLSFLLVLLLSWTLATGPMSLAAAKTATITLVSADLISNDHVGNDWYYAAKVGSKELSIGDSVEVDQTKKITLYGEATESDKYPDSGSKSLSITPSKSLGKEVKIRVTITENRGRYSGNQAVWEFTFSVSK